MLLWSALGFSLGNINNSYNIRCNKFYCFFEKSTFEIMFVGCVLWSMRLHQIPQDLSVTYWTEVFQCDLIVSSSYPYFCFLLDLFLLLDSIGDYS